MLTRPRLSRLAALTAVTGLGTAALAGISLTPAVATTRTVLAPAGATTAWHDGRFAEDTAGVVSRSGIVLGQPNSQPAQYMPLGNGRLAAAGWGADGFTAPLNRTATFPHPQSPAP